MRRTIVASLVIAVVAGFVPAAGVAHAADAEWSNRVRPIARRVERLRRLKFRHPVPVVFTDRGAYRGRVAKLREREWMRLPPDVIDHEEKMLRALGIMVLDETLPEVEQGDLAATRAQYDPVGQQIVVKGRTLDVATEVALAGALTRALQDQRFRSGRLDRWLGDTDASVAYRALADGDAARIEAKYVDTLGVRDQRDYATTADEAALPEHLSFPVFAVRGAPDLFGAIMVRVLQVDGGARAIDRAFRRPPRRQLEMFDPTAVGSPATRVRAPKLDVTREQAIGKPRPVGALTLYTALALRLDNVDAMLAANTVTGSSAQVFLDGEHSHICVRARFRTHGSSDAGLLADTLRRWIDQGGPDTGTVSEPTGGTVLLDACEYENTAFEHFDIGDLVATPLVRNGFVVGQLVGGATKEVAKCVGDELIVDEEFNAAFEALIGVEDENDPAAVDAARRVAQRRAEIRDQCDAQ